MDKVNGSMDVLSSMQLTEDMAGLDAQSRALFCHREVLAVILGEVIKLGSRVYNGKKEDEDYELLRFLNTIMYPHGRDFLDRMSEYIDFSENEELWKEVTDVTGLGACVYKDGLEEGLEKGMEKGLEEGMEKGIRAMVLDNMEECVPADRILLKLQKHFELTGEEAEQYYKRFALDE